MSRSCVFSVSVFLFFSCLSAAADSRPNLVLILADDLGWSDLGCYGNPWFETPHLDQLAQEGIRFTNAYSAAPICSASRSAILTGQTPARLGFEFVTKKEVGYQPMKTPLRAPPYTLDLPLEKVTIPEVLSKAGIDSAFFGKWHVSRHHKGYLGWSPTHGPLKQGFKWAAEDFGAHPYSYWNDKTKRTFLDLPAGEMPVDSMNERAVSFLREEHKKPFFLMVSHFHVHTPVHTRAEWLYEKLLAKIPEDHPRRKDLAHYGAMVTALDVLVGDVLQALDDENLKENTLVIFTSDNGGHPEYAGNSPLRGSKWNLYEGGIRVPMIARWPTHIKKGGICDTPVSGVDLLPTFAEAAGRKIPRDVDGRSILPLLKDPAAELPTRSLTWHFPYYHPETGFDKAPAKIGVNDGFTSQTRPQSAIREGDWKLIHFYEKEQDELYNLAEDPEESQNLRDTEPETSRWLREKLDISLEEMKARLPIAREQQKGVVAKLLVFR
ncbi:MAG: sulfatase [Verrucomicrobiales bacterium]|nr:sulfatase [Verrucomicrobiales bacterium]